MAKPTLIEPHKGDKRFVRRDEAGRFKESDDVGKSLAGESPDEGEDGCLQKPRR